ncbi:MAG: chlorite dismutase family protein, partial [Chloroflexi bacterium]|nr:chlorite dismutase family protein [Chloroflexota bacterium]
MPGNNGRQFVRYAVYKVQPGWRRLGSADKATGKAEFAAVVGEFADKLTIRPYTLMGSRADADFFLWLVGDELSHFQALETRCMSTGLGHYLDRTHSYLAMTRKSAYVDKHQHAGSEGSRLKI